MQMSEISSVGQRSIWFRGLLTFDPATFNIEQQEKYEHVFNIPTLWVYDIPPYTICLYRE